MSMTPREDFLKELGDLVTYTPERCKGAYSESLHEIFFNEFFHRWAPKDTQKLTTKVFPNGSDGFGGGGGSAHYINDTLEKQEKDDISQKCVALSRRDHFAGLALQAMLSSEFTVKGYAKSCQSDDELKRVISQGCVSFADSLIQELDKNESA
jgi:hypothetical protein